MRKLSHVELDLARVAQAFGWRDDWRGCLLHGFGAGAQDLVSLAPELGCARHWIFPHAPVPISVGGMSYGRAWFPRDPDVLQSALFGGYFQSLRAVEPDGLSQAAWELRALIDSASLDWSRLILGGFSQGAMVAAELLRQACVDRSLPMPAVVLLFSGALIAERWWDEVALPEGRVPPAVCQTHGHQDPVLSHADGRALAARLESAGFPVAWTDFDGRHEIPAQALAAARATLSGRVSA